MIPVDQQIMHDPLNKKYGDCMRACIASLLELPYEEVPHFLSTNDDTDFSDSLREFLLTKNLVLFEVMYFEWDSIKDRIFHGAKGVHHLINGMTERGDAYHATVALDGVMVHDPHPSKSGILWDRKETITYSFLVKI